MSRDRPRNRHTARRASWRSRKSLALVFALVFAPVAQRAARAACVEFTTPPAISLAAEFAQSVALADVDGDGDLDALSASSADSKIAWYENASENGDGSSWSLHTISIATYGQRVVVAADVDGDGDLDAISAGPSPGLVAWHENLAPGDGSSWTTHFVSTGANLALDAEAADLDGDGDLDLLTASRFDDRIAWHENLEPGDGSDWLTHEITGTASFATSASAADLDGDGDLDVFYTAYSSDTLGWFENSAVDGDASTWVAHEISTADVGPYFVAAADVDGDGDLDAVTALASAGRVVWFQNPLPGGGPSWALHTITTSAPSALRVSTADLDADGDLDAIVPSYTDDKVAWHENLGGGTAWTIHTLSTSSLAAQWAIAGDVDGDGDLDVASASQNDDTIAWYRNDRLHDRAWMPAFAEISTIYEGPYTVAAADVDGDGDLDAVSSFSAVNTLAWIENLAASGDGSSWTEHVVATSLVPFYAAVPADVDGDGDADLFATQANSNGIAWFENDGGAGWNRTSISVVDLASSIASGDIDGDGDVDVLAGATDGNLTWHEDTAPSGDGTVWSRHLVASATSAAPYSVSLADLDGDGDLDAFVALTSFYAPDQVVWYENVDLDTPGTGNGSVWAPQSVATLEGAFAVAEADFDRDGDLDLLAAAFGGSGAIVGYANDGGGSGWSPFTLLATSAGVLDVAAADLDGDGDVDAVATIDDSGSVLWLENLDGDGATWSLHSLSSQLQGATGIAVADLDGDGDLDPLVAAQNLGAVGWLPNLGTGVFDDGFDSDASPACWSSAAP